MINKGIISSLSADGKKASVSPYFGSVVTAPLTVPFYLLGAVPVGTIVIYTEFPDGTGAILHRLDGDWNHAFEEVL